MIEPHEVDAEYVPMCSTCGKDVVFDDRLRAWQHVEPSRCPDCGSQFKTVALDACALTISHPWHEVRAQ